MASFNLESLRFNLRKLVLWKRAGELLPGGLGADAAGAASELKAG